MSAPPDSAIRYSTIEEVTKLFALPQDKAALLLVKSNAAIEHGKFEPDGVAEKEDMALWVEQGLDKMESLDGIIRRFKDYQVVPSAEVHTVRLSITAMEARLEREEEQAEREKQCKQTTTTGGEEDRATITQRDVEMQDVGDKEISRVEVQEGPGSPIEIPDSPQDEQSLKPARKDKGKGRPLGTGPVPRLRATMSVITYPHQIKGREHEVCDRCTQVKPRSGLPCGGPMKYSATRTVCARCVQAHKPCSFNTSHRTASRNSKRKRRDGEEEDEEEEEESSRTKSRSVDEDESDEVVIRRPKRLRSSKGTKQSAERLAQEGEEEDCALGEAVREAYEVLGRAHERLLLVQLRANRALSEAAGRGSGAFKM